MHKLSDQKKRKLLNNTNVSKLTANNIVYTSKFKIQAVEKYLKGASPNKIFEDAGISPSMFKKKYCLSCLMRWKKKYLEEGKATLKVSQTGRKASGRPKLENPDELNLEELRALVEIQREMIDMLKKNRALAKKKKVK